MIKVLKRSVMLQPYNYISKKKNLKQGPMGLNPRPQGNF